MGTVNSYLPEPLVAQVLDEVGQPVRGRRVTFDLPSVGPGARFNGRAPVATVVTNAGGFAVSPPFVANSVQGPYRVLAAVQGAGQPALFMLENRPATIAPLSAVFRPAMVAQSSASTGAIAGTVTNTSGSALGGICATAFLGHHYAGSAVTSSGTYTISGLEPGTYAVEFSPNNCGSSGNYLTQWYTGAAGGAPIQALANPVTVTASGTTQQLSTRRWRPVARSPVR
ncbi:MAG: carboxypeptidase-like regulatory domain-containing protein [Actinobacteria bacterium]|nr:carboxypeptidase-like regulatory domain-containing protein [Actinomycetota bacterium]